MLLVISLLYLSQLLGCFAAIHDLSTAALRQELQNVKFPIVIEDSDEVAANQEAFRLLDEMIEMKMNSVKKQLDAQVLALETKLQSVEETTRMQLEKLTFSISNVYSTTADIKKYLGHVSTRMQENKDL